jgi:hypothetical protein
VIFSFMAVTWPPPPMVSMVNVQCLTGRTLPPQMTSPAMPRWVAIDLEVNTGEIETELA